VLETIEHHEKSGKPGLVVIADFEKAFENVWLEFIYKCPEYYSFGESLIQWVKVRYSNPRCKIVNNVYFSGSNKLSRGVKQGCPLSAYLLIMAIEMLAVKIPPNNNIKRLEIQGLKMKVSLYADDSCFILNPQFGSLHSLIEDLDIFFTTNIWYILHIRSQKNVTLTLQCSFNSCNQ
jgi:hypothetical protein